MKKYNWIGLSIIVAGILVLVAFIVFGRLNHPPTIPSDPKPADGGENVGIENLVLSWGCSDPDGDPLTYEVYLGTDPDNLEMIARDLKKNLLKLERLEGGKVYYWYVVARDSRGGTSSGPVWQFSTKRISHPPEITSFSPSDGSQNVQPNVSLSWSARDPDGDEMKYDLYFGEDPNPPLVLRDSTSNTYTPQNLEAGKVYYWKLVVKDSTGEKTESPVWKFKVSAPPTPPQALNPLDGSTDVSLSVKLEWFATDPQNSKLVYDLYFGTPESLEPIATNLEENSYLLKNLRPGTLYNWKVVARNEMGLETEGPTWEFKTASRVNNPPYPPNSPIPANGEMDVELEPTLSWDCSDPDGDPITYEIWLGTDESSLILVATDLREPRYVLKNLDSGKTYFWRVVARDSKGATSTGDLWHFTTFFVSNTPPNPPISVSPSQTENLPTSVVLEWKSSDPDGDALTFDLYFGDNPNPPLLKGGLKTQRFELKNLEYDKTYYWYVVAKDSKGATSKSPVWSFTTRVKSLPKPPMSRIFVAGGAEGVYIVDVSNPLAPRIVQRVPSTGVKRLAVGSSRVYEELINVVYGAARNRGLRVLRYTGGKLNELTYLKNVGTNPVDVLDVEIHGNIAVLALGIGGMGVVDVTYPANPRWLGFLKNVPGIVRSVYLEGDTAYLACGRGGIVVASLKKPYKPEMTARIEIKENVSDVVVSKGLAYVVDNERGVALIDISDPSKPKELAYVPIDGAQRVRKSESLLFVVGGSGLTVIDVSDAKDPKILSTVQTKGRANGVLVALPYVFIASDELSVVYMEDPRKPKKVGKVDFGSVASSLTSSNSELFLADGLDGIKVFSLDKRPKLLGRLEAPSFVADMLIVGDVLYALDRIDGLVPIDLKSERIIEGKRIPMAGFAKSMVFYDNRIYIVSELTDEVSIVDVSSPRDPKLMENLNMETPVYDIARYGDKILVVGEKLVVIDASKNDVEESIDLDGMAKSVAVFGNKLVLGGDFWLKIYELSSSEGRMDLKEKRRIPLGPVDGILRGNGFIIAYGETGFAVLDEDGKILSEVETPAPVLEAMVHGDVLYIADGENGLVVYDISDPKNPVLEVDMDWLNFYDAIEVPWEEKE